MSKLNLFDLNKYDDLKNDDNNNSVNPVVNSNVNSVNHSVTPVVNGEDGSKVSQPIDEGTDTVNCVSADDVAYALSDTRSDAVRIVNELAARHIDITETYKQWVSVAFALISEFGEQGREMFHMLSRQNSRYQYEESDRKFSSCLKSHGSGITIKTIFHLAKEAGVELANHENYLHEERRTGTTTTTSTTSPTGVVNNENIEKSTVLGCFNENVGVSDLSYLSYFPLNSTSPSRATPSPTSSPWRTFPPFSRPFTRCTTTAWTATRCCSVLSTLSAD